MYIKTEKKTEKNGLIKVTFNDNYAEIEYRQHHFVAPKIVVNDLLFVQCEDTDDQECEYLFKTAGFWHCYPSVWTKDEHNCWTEKQKIDDTVDAIIDACDTLLDGKKQSVRKKQNRIDFTRVDFISIFIIQQSIKRKWKYDKESLLLYR